LSFHNIFPDVNWQPAAIEQAALEIGSAYKFLYTILCLYQIPETDRHGTILYRPFMMIRHCNPGFSRLDMEISFKMMDKKLIFGFNRDIILSKLA
jgi:hypothetical protein